VVGARLAKLAPGDSTTVTFAIVAAPSLTQLQAAADAAASSYATLLPTRSTAVAAEFHVYPNPTSGPLRVELPPSFGGANLRVTNALGQAVLSETAIGCSASLDLAGLAPGLYVLRAQGTAGVLSRTFVVR
jgi:serine protease